jgi:molecular chaperone DnaK
MSQWAIDFGTTNSAVARWNNQDAVPEMIHIYDITRKPLPGQEIEVKYSIPTCLYLLEQQGLKRFFGRFLEKIIFIGTQGLIGRAAIEKDSSAHSSKFVSNFKPALIRDSYKILTKYNNRAYTARKVTTIFLRELLSYVKKETSERPRNITFSVPVDSYEPYRAQLKQISARLGVKKFKVIDEPVAAAIGYGLRIDEPQNVLVIDFGGGTLDFALIRIEEKHAELGRCRVIAKEGAPVGGNLVDAWLLEEFCKQLSYDLNPYDESTGFWYRIMLEEACRVKESLFFKDMDTFYLTPPKELQNFEARLYAENKKLNRQLDFTRRELIELLEKKGLYSQIEIMLNRILKTALSKGIPRSNIKEVLMVGGSVLLPEIYSIVEKRFGRDRVRAWKPFDAVAYGACAFSAGKLIKSDFITHDYAFKTYNKETHKPEYHIIVPQGTPFPTVKDFWKRQLVPTCSLGEPETVFKLIICEIGRRYSTDQEFVWDSNGKVHSFKEDDDNAPLIIPLNESNPALGTLNPPHSPKDRSARLEISFMINEDRWLCTNVYDIKIGKNLLENSPVLRLK